jgi:glutamate racemase
MIDRRWIMALIAGAGMAATPAGGSAQTDVSETIAEIARKDAITVLVTDSGLGGLSVAADIERRARTSGAYRSLHIIFANALPEASRGYNRMPTVERKVQVFDDALAGMVRWYKPDVILVACNTLSVLIPRTRGAQGTPLLGIVAMGVDMLEEKLKADPASSAIIFGTETTVAAGTHRSMLIDRGIAPERIVLQACPNLAGEIEADAKSDVVQTMIDLYASEAMGNLSRKDAAVVAGLCCTHYGYCGKEFAEALRPLATGGVQVVNPNERMSDVLFPAGKKPFAGTPEVTVRVVSRAFISEVEIRSIGSLLEAASSATSAALNVYERKADLFPFDEH